jgi:hypothetical protein
MSTLNFGNITEADFSSGSMLHGDGHNWQNPKNMNFNDLMLFVRIAEMNEWIKDFSLYNFAFNNFDEMLEFTQAIIKNKNIRSINFSYSTIDALHLREILINMQWLDGISLRAMNYNSIEFGIVFDGLKENKNISYINLDKNLRIGAYEFGELYNALVGNYKIMQVILSDFVLYHNHPEYGLSDMVDEYKIILDTILDPNNNSVFSRIRSLTSAYDNPNIPIVSFNEDLLEKLIMRVVDNSTLRYKNDIFDYRDYYMTKPWRNEESYLTYNDIPDKYRYMVDPEKCQFTHEIVMQIVNRREPRPGLRPGPL